MDGNHDLRPADRFCPKPVTETLSFKLRRGFGMLAFFSMLAFILYNKTAHLTLFGIDAAGLLVGVLFVVGLSWALLSDKDRYDTDKLIEEKKYSQVSDKLKRKLKPNERSTSLSFDYVKDMTVLCLATRELGQHTEAIRYGDLALRKLNELREYEKQLLAGANQRLSRPDQGWGILLSAMEAEVNYELGKCKSALGEYKESEVLLRSAATALEESILQSQNPGRELVKSDENFLTKDFSADMIKKMSANSAAKTLEKNKQKLEFVLKALEIVQRQQGKDDAALSTVGRLAKLLKEDK